MPLVDLDHVYIDATDVEATKDFYCDVLGFEVAPRPDFGFHGYWLALDGRVRIHMGQRADPPHGESDSDSTSGRPAATPAPGSTPGSRPGSTPGSTPATESTTRRALMPIDHVAFTATDPVDIARRLNARGLPVRRRYFAAGHLCQLFVHDPDGVQIELNFPGIETEPDW